jgi:hypothetical protein
VGTQASVGARGDTEASAEWDSTTGGPSTRIGIGAPLYLGLGRRSRWVRHPYKGKVALRALGFDKNQTLSCVATRRAQA